MTEQVGEVKSKKFSILKVKPACHESLGRNPDLFLISYDKMIL